MEKLKFKDVLVKIEEYIEGLNNGAFKLSNIKYPIHRIDQAIKKNERILLYGDYDADGICSTAIFAKFLQDIGYSNFDYIIPTRYDGYGINEKAYKKHSQEFDLIITLDNGSNANFLTGKENNIIIIDHHPYPDERRKWAYNINPNNQAGEVSTTAGVVAYLFLRMYKRYVNADFDPESYIDLAAITAISDMASMSELNRLIVSRGLEKINESNEGIYRFYKKNGQLKAMDLSFGIISHINAIGRIGANPTLAVDMMLQGTREYYDFAEAINSKKKDMVNGYIKTFRRELESQVEGSGAQIYFLYSEEMPIGLCGLVANQLFGMTGKNIVVLSRHPEYDNVYTGSGRGDVIKDILLSAQKKVDFNFGGHNAAIGIKVEKDKLPELIQECEKIYIEQEEKESIIGEIDANTLERVLEYAKDLEAPIDMKLDFRLIDYRFVGMQEYKNGYANLVLASDKGYLSFFVPNTVEVDENNFEETLPAMEINVSYNGMVSLKCVDTDIKPHRDLQYSIKTS